MTYPSIYNVSYSYTGFQQAQQGVSTFPGTQLDADLAGLHSSVSALSTFMQNVIRSDGALNNGIVTLDSLAPLLQFNTVSSALGISFTPTGGVSSTTVQDAIAELDAEKLSIANAKPIATTGVPSDLITGLTAWMPVLTFATPGDLAVTYANQLGRYAKLSSNLVLVQFSVSTSLFTFTTASGNFQISGLPFMSQNTNLLIPRGGLSFGGINKVGFSQVALGMAVNTSALIFNASGMGVTAGPVTAADTPSGGTVVLTGEIIIFI